MATFLDLDSKEELVRDVFQNYDRDFTGELTAEQLYELYITIRHGGISLAQVAASIRTICATDACWPEELVDVLNEMDRRYYLVQDLQWEFVLLDKTMKGTISIADAKFLFQAVHDEYFSQARFDKFLKSRLVPETDLSFAEIEVPLCDIPSKDWLEEERLEKERERQDILRRKIDREKTAEMAKKHERAIADARAKAEREAALKREQEARRRAEEEEARRREEEDLKKRMEEAKNEEEERRRREEEDKLKSEDEKRREEEEARRRAEEEKRREEEERKRREMEEEERQRQEAAQKWKKAELQEQQRLEEERLRKEKEEKERREKVEAENAEDVAEEAAEAEAAAAEAARRAAELRKQAQDDESRQAAEEAEKKALAEAQANKERRLRANLKAAQKSRKIDKLEKSIKEAKDAKIPRLKKDIDDAERTLKGVRAGKNLKDAIARRHLDDLVKAMNHVRTGGWENDYKVELTEAEKLANRLRRLERLRAEILELKQSTIHEIRSYQKPPPAVHKVMIATYLLLDYKEKPLHDWKNMQALLGKTGKEGLKRQVTTLDPMNVNLETGNYADNKFFSGLDLEIIRDVSAGAATFYVWASNMIEEARACVEEKAKMLEEAEKEKKEEAEEEKKREERRKARKAGDKSPVPQRKTSRSGTIGPGGLNKRTSSLSPGRGPNPGRQRDTSKSPGAQRKTSGGASSTGTGQKKNIDPTTLVIKSPGQRGGKSPTRKSPGVATRKNPDSK